MLADDAVGRPRVDIITPGQDKPRSVGPKQPFDGGLCLLIRGGTRVENVRGTLLSFVLNRVHEEVVPRLEDWQHRFAARGGPSTEDDCYAVPIDESCRPGRKHLGSRLTVLLDRDQCQALTIDRDTPRSIDLANRKKFRLGHGILGHRQRPGSGVEHTHLHNAVELRAPLWVN